MKKSVSGTISHATVSFLKLISRILGGKKRKTQESAGCGKEVLDELAKAFIWQHIPEQTKQWFVHVIQLPEEERKKWYVRNLYLEGTIEQGQIIREVARLSYGDILQNPKSETGTIPHAAKEIGLFEN